MPSELCAVAGLENGTAIVGTVAAGSELLTVQRDGGVVRAVGEIDASTCSQLDEILHSLDDAEPAFVDLSAVTFMDSSGLRVLIEHHYLRADSGHSLTTMNPSRPVSRLLEITGLDGVLNVVSE